MIDELLAFFISLEDINYVFSLHIICIKMFTSMIITIIITIIIIITFTINNVVTIIITVIINTIIIITIIIIIIIIIIIFDFMCVLNIHTNLLDSLWAY